MPCRSTSSVAEKLKMGLAVDPEEFAEVTIYFSGNYRLVFMTIVEFNKERAR